MPFSMDRWLDAVAGADDLKLRELRVLLVMSRFATWATGGDIRPSTATIAAAANVTTGNLRGRTGAVEILVSKGWLIRTHPATNTAPAVYALGFGSHRPVRDVPRTGTSPEQGPPQTGDVPKMGTSDDLEVPRLGTSTTGLDVPELGTSPEQGRPQTGDVWTSPNWGAGRPQTGALDVPKLGTQPTQDLHKTNTDTYTVAPSDLVATQSPLDVLIPPAADAAHTKHAEIPINTDAVKRRRAPAYPLPAGWVPNETHRQRACERGVDVDVEAEKFRAHAEANDRRQARWDAAFTQWLLNARPPYGSNGSNGGVRVLTRAQEAKRQVYDVWDQQAARMEAELANQRHAVEQ